MKLDWGMHMQSVAVSPQGNKGKVKKMRKRKMVKAIDDCVQVCLKSATMWVVQQ